MRAWRVLIVGVCLTTVAGCSRWCCHPWFNGCGPFSRLCGRCRVIEGPVVAPLPGPPAPEGLFAPPGYGPTVIESEHSPIFAAPPGFEPPPGSLRPPPAPNLEAPPSQKESAPAPRPAPPGMPTLAKPLPNRTTTN
jgi:hypothetical protein